MKGQITKVIYIQFDTLNSLNLVFHLISHQKNNPNIILCWILGGNLGEGGKHNFMFSVLNVIYMYERINNVKDMKVIQVLTISLNFDLTQ